MRTIPAALVASAAALALALAFVLAIVSISGAEEDEVLFNCHLSGNLICGPNEPGHFGFINI